jgi:glycosyltransferase involved in cell wall biosynthesis
MKSVDVVIPCYNYARFLRSCVTTVLQQDGVNVRVLVIDDGSPDNTPEVCRALAVEDSRVSYRRHEPNQGFFPTINEGLFGWASAEYCMLLSADDALAPGALARATTLMNLHPDVGMVYGLGMVLRGEAEPHGAPEASSDYETDILPGSRFLEFCCKVGNPVPTPAAVLRTALQHKIGPYAPELPHTSDYEMWMRCALHSNIGFIRAVQGYYRWHGSNMSTAYYADRMRDLREVMHAVEKVVADAGDRVAAPDQLLSLSRRRCAEGALIAAHGCFDVGDKDGVKAYLDLVAEQGCSLSNFTAGKTLRLKQQLGLGGYRLLKPVVDFARGFGSRPNVPRGFKLIGEWPEPRSSTARNARAAEAMR